MSRGFHTAVVADDDADVREVVAGVLEVNGWRTFSVEDGEQAVLKALEVQPDLMVLDVMMPRQGGLDTLKELRSDPRTAHIPVIMLSAVNEIELGERKSASSVGSELGVRAPEAFLEKPVDTEALLRSIALILSR